ncbi:MAG: cell division protein ZipA [Oceanospirillales bacterium]|nr:MAG: cell division protein ZipA [Oceanospirillales bacterium]
MEISLREWLIIGGILMIALILFDGWRRISASRNRLKIDIDKSLSELGESNHHNPELPNGGARVRQFDQEPFFSDTGLESELQSDKPKSKLDQSKSSKLTKVAGKLASSVSASSASINRTDRQEPKFNLNIDVESQFENEDPIELQSAMLDGAEIKDKSAEVESVQNSEPDELIFDEQAATNKSEFETSDVSGPEEAELPAITPEVSIQKDREAIQEEFKQEVQAEFSENFEEKVHEEDVPVEISEKTHYLHGEQEAETSLVESESPAAVPQDLEWDPELEKQFDHVEPVVEPPVQAKQPEIEPEDKTPDFADLDPLFDDIPTDPLPPLKANNSEAKIGGEQTKGFVKDKGKEEPNLFLDLDLDQPIHQLMANKAAEAKANREATRRVKDKPAAREELTSLSLPLEPELKSDLELNLEPELDDLFADFDGVNPLEEASVEPIRKSAEKSDTNKVTAEKPAIKPIEKSNVDSQAKTQSEKQAEIKASSNAQDVEKSRSAATAARKALSDLPDPEEVLVITVVGKSRQLLDGERLKRVVEACGMEHGDMSIYHRFDGTGAAASLQFSMANAVNPGTFDPNAMDRLETPAVSFFMSMREPRDAMTAYECMLATAETLAKHLDGDLLDEDRSVMREQTKEHYRQRIRDFEMQTRRRNLTR